MSRKIVLVSAVVLAVAALCVAALLAPRPRPADSAAADALSLSFPVPPFAFAEAGGAAFSSDALDGKVWLGAFIFTRCPGACPHMTGHLLAIQKRFAGREDFAIVTISTDPEHDTPDVLAKYADSLGADRSQWHFLTGDFEAVRTLSMDGFKLGIGDTPNTHSSRFALVDRTGHIREYFEGSVGADVDALSRAVETLLAEPGME